MAECPKCGAHLRLADWKQKCPHCGANVFLYNLQERLMQDADAAEVEHYYYQKKVDRAKASFIGSRLAVVRIFTSLLPVGAVFLPLLRTKPGSSGLPATLDAMKLYDFFSKADLNAFLAAAKAEPTGRLFVAALACLVLSLVFWLLHFLLLFLSCSPHGKARNFTLAGLSLAFALGFAGLVVFLPRGAFTAASLAIGAYLYLLLTAANLAVELLTFKQGIKVTHKPCCVGAIPIEEYFEMQKNGVPQEEIRAEQYRRLTALQEEKERTLQQEEAHAHGKKKEAGPNG